MAVISSRLQSSVWARAVRLTAQFSLQSSSARHLSTSSLRAFELPGARPACSIAPASSSSRTAWTQVVAAQPLSQKPLPRRCTMTPIRAVATATAVAFEPETLPTVSVYSSGISGWEGDLLVIAVTEDDFVTEGEVTSLKTDRIRDLDAAFGGALAEIASVGGFEGKQGSQSRVVRVGSAPGAKAKYVGLVGLGKAAKVAATAEWGATCFKALGTAVSAMAKAHKSQSVGVVLLEGVDKHGAAAVSQVASGALLGGYESSRFKSKPSPTASRMKTLSIIPSVTGADAGLSAAAAVQAVQQAEDVVRGVTMARYLVEAPANVCTPTHLAEAARHIAESFPDVMKLQVHEKEQCEEWGMGMYLGVAQASDEPPKFIHLTYTPAGGEVTKKIALVGKGLTFDSGGYNIKAGPGCMIELMKFDMGGAAATLGAARILASRKPAGVEVHFIIAACENMVSGRGMRPGDILRAANGKTVEVNNTDAEGRLTLGDALWYAQEKCGATSIVDSATLTGACIIALGSDIAGLFTPSDSAAAAVQAAAKAAGEKLWRMPWEESYFDSMKSPVADMKNTGSRSGGAISAALFLKQFVKEGVEWAHLDIAGPVWDEKAGLPTGYGAALLAEWATAQGAKSA